MGGSVSAGKNNDELIDHLVEAEFIKTLLVQRAFRAVDRKLYLHENHVKSAYKDIAWREEHLHLSAPCVYAVVLESLKLKPGLSFLNIGSGTGYLSTMAGLILGIYGVNHGIELHSDAVEFATDRLEDFLQTSTGIDYYDFCEPSFVVGNCLNLDSSCQQYDRVYCGAACPEEYEQHMKNFLKVHGILVMPLQDKLLKVTRTSETEWRSVKILSTSFTSLVLPDSSEETVSTVQLCHKAPPQLQMICRSNIRSMIRHNITKEHPECEWHQKVKEKRPRMPVRHVAIPSFCEHGNLQTCQSIPDVGYDTDDLEYTLNSRLPPRMCEFLQDLLSRNEELQMLRSMESNSSDSEWEAEYPAGSLSSEDEDDKTPTEQSSKRISLPDYSVVESSSDESSDLSESPSRIRKKRCLKRRRQDAKGLPSTSSQSATEPLKKVKRSATVAWKSLVGLKENEVIDIESPTLEVSLSYLMFDRIKSLPLPPQLLKYLNYSRSKFPEIPESE